MKKEILILGAGPAGIATAFELYKSDKHFIVIEKNDQVGGLARTFHYGDFITDVGPHRFFSQNQYLYNLIEDLLGKHWIKVDRLTRFYINGKYFLYPIEISNALINVGPYKAFKIISDYLKERVKKVLSNRKAISFEEQIVSEFGRSLAELNMLNYTEKIWGLPCSEISPDWSKQRIRGLSFIAILKKALIKSKKGPKTLVDQFYYPDLGTGLIYEKIKERVLSDSENSILLKSYPIKIHHNNKEIIGIDINIGRDIINVNPIHVVSSIPITEFVNLLEPNAPEDVLNSAGKLKFRSHVSLFLTLNKPKIFPDQWIYFPDKEIPFGRVMEPKNFSKRLSPKDKTSLLLEFFCWENDKIWNSSREELLDLSIKHLEKLEFIKREEIIDLFVHREKYAYPVYDLKYKENLKKVKDYLNQFENLQLIGRAGSFRYNNQDHALEMGILAARNIIEGRKYNIEEIGSEQKYFERGYLK
ncbi:MAG: FAD-dependent oxidoreductase [Candidatus Altiarchaeota archaeon]